MSFPVEPVRLCLFHLRIFVLGVIVHLNCLYAALADGLAACLHDEREQRGLHCALQRPGSGARRGRALDFTPLSGKAGWLR